VRRVSDEFLLAISLDEDGDGVALVKGSVAAVVENPAALFTPSVWEVVAQASGIFYERLGRVTTDRDGGARLDLVVSREGRSLGAMRGIVTVSGGKIDVSFDNASADEAAPLSGGMEYRPGPRSCRIIRGASAPV
jgi:hypothetical protein